MSDAYTPSLRQLLKNPVHLLAFGFGSGLGPVFPGTWGTLAAVPLLVVAAACLNWWSYLILLLAMSLLGIYLCGKTAADIGVHDHGGIVFDEFVGLLFCLCPLFWQLPAIDSWQFWLLIFLAVLLFRVFDIKKPPPIKIIDQKLGGGWGIMLDDIIAGIMTWLCLLPLFYLFNPAWQ